MDYWRYLCNAGTRPESLRRQLIGGSRQRPVAPGDTILLYDYSDNEIYGPMTALTGCEKNIVENAWGGRYPYQVRVNWDELHRVSSSWAPRIETGESLSLNEFEDIVELLQEEGDRLMLPEWGSPAAAFAGDAVAEPDETQISTALEELEAKLESEPPDATPVQHTTVDYIAREEAFRRAVRAAYDQQCSVCGVRRETPDRRPEVEAAHIRQKAEGGPDDIRNGIALCKLHHWAFDNGWFTLTSDHRVAVADYPDRDGYTEFMKLDGRKMQLPDDSRKHPASKYLE